MGEHDIHQKTENAGSHSEQGGERYIFSGGSNRLFLSARARVGKLTRWAARENRLFIWCLSAGLVALSWFLQSHIDFWVSDEGSLWYGAWRVAHGEVPIRDFRSYDPGRYYWIAFWSRLFGDGLLGQRAGVALFQVIGLAWGLFAARSVVHKRRYLFTVGLLLLVWMYPRHKLFESALAMGAVYVATHLIEKSSPKRFWLAGVFVGLAGFFGRNLGLYTLLAFLAILLMLRWQTKERLLPAAARLMGGVLAGYLPMFLLMMLSPGFLSSFVDSVLVILNRGSTNLPLPIPWPWTVKLAGQGWLLYEHQVLLGVTYLVLFAFILAVLTAIFLRPAEMLKGRSLLVAATFVGLAYVHHACVRADVSHLAQAIHPLLLGLVAVIALYGQRGHRVVAAAAAGGLGILTIFVPGYAQPFVAKMLYPQRFVQEAVRGGRIWMPPSQAMFFAAVRDKIEPNLGQDDLVFFAPYTPGMYAVLGRRSPVWDIYPIEIGRYSPEQPQSPELQQRMIEELRQGPVKYAIMDDAALDGKENLRFRYTHPSVWKYLLEDFRIVEDRSFPSGYLVFRRTSE